MVKSIGVTAIEPRTKEIPLTYGIKLVVLKRDLDGNLTNMARWSNASILTIEKCYRVKSPWPNINSVTFRDFASILPLS